MSYYNPFSLNKNHMSFASALLRKEEEGRGGVGGGGGDELVSRL